MSRRETHDRDSHEKQDHEKKDQEKKDHEKYEPKADHVTCRNTEKDHYDTKAVCDVALAALELAKQTECNAYLDMKAQPIFSAICDPNKRSVGVKNERPLCEAHEASGLSCCKNREGGCSTRESLSSIL